MIDNVNIERVYKDKFLGVILDHKICWKPHIRYVLAKLARNVTSNTRKNKTHSGSAHLAHLYCSLVLMYLSCCVEVWGNIYESTLQPLCILQKRVVRIVNNEVHGSGRI